jgi:hypothetical protein
VLVQEFSGETLGGESVGLVELTPAEERDREEDGCG